MIGSVYIFHKLYRNVADEFNRFIIILIEIIKTSLTKFRSVTFKFGSTSIQQHSKTAVDDFVPSNSAVIVDGNPSRATETVANHMMSRPICN